MYVVTEYLDMDLKNYMAVHQGLGLNPSLIKRFLHQILCGIGYCHSHRVLHRDLQPENLLIHEGTNTLKLAGFGSTRAFEIPLKILTEEVVAIWYRAPEILLGSRYYSTPVDVWSVGCIFAEMVNGKVLFGEETEISVLREIFSYLGTPNNETWHGVELSSKFVPATPKCPPKDLTTEFPTLEATGVDLLSRMLCLDPSKRITVRSALKHEYFDDLEL